MPGSHNLGQTGAFKHQSELDFIGILELIYKSTSRFVANLQDLTGVELILGCRMCHFYLYIVVNINFIYYSYTTI